VGALGLNFRRAHVLDDAESTFLNTLAGLCAQALERARLYEQAQRAVRTRDDFISIAAHELRTPVTSVKGLAQLMIRQLSREGTGADGGATRGLRDALETIVTQADRMSRLTGDLFDISRLDTGKVTLSLETVDLAALAREAAAAAQATADVERHPIEVDAPEPVAVRADPERLHQVLANLLSNAIKFSPRGGAIGVEVGVSAGDEPGALIAVRDHGPGIPAQDLPRVFDRFYQSGAGKREGQSGGTGLGLGLYICREIVRLHGGTIAAELPPDGGTRFIVRLPLA
jgi:signal transduction histidine kinase